MSARLTTRGRVVLASAACGVSAVAGFAGLGFNEPKEQSTRSISPDSVIEEMEQLRYWYGGDGEEDQSGWDCRTMGNGVCGNGR